MRAWSECSGGGSFTAFGWCLAVLCVAPFFVDVAACDEFSAAPLHQPVLVDGEQVDPSEDTAGPLPHDHHHSSHMAFSTSSDLRRTKPVLVPAPPPDSAVISLTSRPPPVL